MSPGRSNDLASASEKIDVTMLTMLLYVATLPKNASLVTVGKYM
jgi:hypothetical protein